MSSLVQYSLIKWPGKLREDRLKNVKEGEGEEMILNVNHGWDSPNKFNVNQGSIS